MKIFKKKSARHRVCYRALKMLIIMKLTICLFLVSTLGVLANDLYAQKTRLSLEFRDTPLERVLSSIEDQSEFYFLYSKKVVDVERKVDISVTEETVPKILDLLFDKSNETYSIMGRQIVLTIPGNPWSPSSEYKVAEINQQSTVSGTVTDISGEPVPGVSIVIKGTTQGTVTNTDGKYILSSLPENATLIFSFVGLRSQEIVVGNQSTINITMEEDVIGIEEVVAIGYGTQERRRVTSSIATVKEEDFMQGAVYQSPLELISGRIGGLGISHARGGDPTSEIEIQLRGVSSIRGSTAPLIIIDGVPGGYLSAISPENIASIDVLRDGSAAAIYGTRATNGVIIITTKKGIPGKPEIKYSGYAYTERWFNKPRLLTADEYRFYKNEWANSDDPFLAEKAYSMVDYGGNSDWFDVITQNAISQVHDLSMSGGSESTQYYGSLNYRQQNGFVKETGKNVMNGSLSLTHRALEDRLSFQLNLNNSFISSHPFNNEIMVQPMSRNPTQLVYNDGTSPLNPDGKYWEEGGYNVPNPLGLIEQFERNNEDSRFLGNMQISYEFIKGLKFSVNGSYQRSNEIRGLYEEKKSWYSLNETSYNGVATRSAYKRESYTVEPMINYLKTFSNVHSFEALAGYSYQDFIDESFSASNRTFITDALSYNNLGAGLAISMGNYANPVSSAKAYSRLIAFFGRINYSYDNKYLLSASLRREGSSKFGADHKWGYFPAASAGWNISREAFMENVNFIDDLKIRFGYGVTGNHGIGNYLSLQRMGTSGVMYFNDQWIPGYAPVSNPNPDLRWEKKAETNIGIDLAILQNISINIDLYNRKTTDLLYEYAVPVPPNLYGSTWANVGEINNKGIELTFTASPVQTKKFSWKTNFNISYNKNMLVSLSDENYDHSYLVINIPSGARIGFNEVPIFKIEEDQPLGNIFGYEFAGFSEEGKWQIWDETGIEKKLASTGSFDDKKIIGNGLPKSYLGFINNFIYGNFDLTVALRGAIGFEIMNLHSMARENLNRLPQNILYRAISDPEISKIRDSKNYETSYHVEPGDFVKLDNLTLGYTIPIKAVKQFRIYGSAKNLFCLTQYTGEDPEQQITGLMPGYDNIWNYPKVKTFSFGLNVNF